eukprot:CAMPEP_0170615260 /NCGR_PEP_ID=MMETSP0224-20130122/25241_1 /TAXON_ID=285029 /ORGANISM="Togula jolla, Strain CCCM 725" /LENGTH=257 /DNA_ID=CAMNT_0010940977 /DNA_START=65 /DNA_END=838 /DNA_ORIENTATION=-
MAEIMRAHDTPALVDYESNSEPSTDDPTTAYNNMIRHCMRLGNIQEGEALLRDMENCGVTPNVFSFNLVLNSYACKGDVQRSASLLDEMLDRNITPNDVTYATVCKVMAFNGQVRQIEEFMELLRQRDVKLNVYFYGALISACGRMSPPDVATAERTFSELVQMGLKPQSVKRCLARAVGVSRASAMISRACQHNAANNNNENHQTPLPVKALPKRDCGFTSQLNSSRKVNTFRKTAPVQMLPYSFGGMPEIIRLSF